MSTLKPSKTQNEKSPNPDEGSYLEISTNTKPSVAVQVSKSLAQVAFFVFVLLLVVTFVFGEPFYLHGKEYGFKDRPFWPKGWVVTAEVENNGYNRQPIAGMTKHNGVCFLTYIGGHFEGRSENVHVGLDDEGWYIQNVAGFSNADIQSKATCLKLSESAADHRK